jgi:unsaturated rhamnogalacturonyl hydrolase
MWLDGIFMASTFMAQYAKEFNAPEWFDEATTQAKIIYEKLSIQSQGSLFMHGMKAAPRNGAILLQVSLTTPGAGL